MSDEYVIHGEQLKVPISNQSLGIELYNALRDNKEAPIFIDAASGETVTNKTLLKNSCFLAHGLRNLKLNKNDIVAIYSENNLYYFNPVLAALFCGIPVTTFGGQYTEGELTYVANLSQPSIVFCSIATCEVILNVKDRLKVLPKVIIIDQKDDYKGCQSMENFIRENVLKDFDVNQFEPTPVNTQEKIAFILYSSGTTGLPKGVMLKHHNYNASLAIFENTMPVDRRGNPALAFVPFCHAYGLFMVFLKIVWKSVAIVMKKFSPELYLKTIQDYKIEELNIVPSIAHFLAKSDLVNKYDLSCVKAMYSGAASLSKDLQQTIIKRFNVKNIHQGYGMTEATVGVMAHLDNTKENPVGSSGHILPSLSVKVMDIDTKKSLGPMQRGELWIRGGIIMKGYLNNPQATKDVIDEDGWLHTGDIVYYDKNSVFYVVDRLKNVMKCKGYQVSPAELEAILINHPKISDVAVIGVPDEKDGEVPFAFVVQNEMVSEIEVQDFVAARVASYKRIRGVKFVSQIPRNSNGKILHRLLRDEFLKKQA